jgi:hypothetical protein
MRRHVVIAWVVLFAWGGICPMSPAAADSAARPFWTEQAMFRFGDEMFFVGRASCTPTVEDGREQAFERAVRELLNYAQASTTAGLVIETQMVYHERNTEDCPQKTVTVWRLLRVPAGDVAKLPKGVPHASLHEPVPPPAPPRDLTPKVGMTRDEVFGLFGQPRTVSVKRRAKEMIWEYPRFGLTLVFDLDNVLKRWTLKNPKTRIPADATSYR